MKMQNSLSSGVSQPPNLMAHLVFTSDSCSLQVTGVVKAVHVKEGDTVDEDQILVEIE